MPCEALQGDGAIVAPARPLQPNGTEVYAALDLGTNNCRLLIACPVGDGFRVVDSFSRIIRLGEGISATGCISDAAIDRAIAALSVCRDKIQTRKARRLRLIATEACRAASNADGFRDRVAAETGIQLEVIKLPEAKKGFVLLPRRWVVERSFAWTSRFRRLARDYERLQGTLEQMHYAVFAILMLAKAAPELKSS